MPSQLGDRTIGELLALLAHDLRNPLSALHSNLGFVRSIAGSDDAAVDEAIEDGLVSCDGLNHIIDNLDLLGRALREEIEGAPERIDVGELMRDVVTRTASMAESHGVRVDLENDAFEGEVDARRDLAFRAVANLVRNAIQHAGPTRRVSFGVRRDHDDVVITVRDQGTSLSVDADPDPFSAAGQIAAKVNQHGRYSRGLGLLCVRIAAEADGWHLAVQPTEGGNAFSLRHPMLRE